MELWPPDHFDLPPIVLGFLHRPHLAKRRIAPPVGGNRSRLKMVHADDAERKLGDRPGCSLKNGGAPARRERETPLSAAEAGLELRVAPTLVKQGRPLAEVRGLIFLGFPLHPPKQPSDARAEHLSKVRVPMLFLQGARDEFAQPTLLNPVISRLGVLATLRVLPGADHSFRVPARGHTTHDQINDEMLDALTGWVDVMAPA